MSVLQDYPCRHTVIGRYEIEIESKLAESNSRPNWGPICEHDSTLISAWISHHICTVKYGMKFLIHSKTSTLQPLKFGTGYVIFSYTLEIDVIGHPCFHSTFFENQELPWCQLYPRTHRRLSWRQSWLYHFILSYDNSRFSVVCDYSGRYP